MFEDVTHERWLILFLSLTDPDILGQSKFIDYEIDNMKNLASEKSHRQRILTEHVAMYPKKQEKIKLKIYDIKLKIMIMKKN